MDTFRKSVDSGTFHSPKQILLPSVDELIVEDTLPHPFSGLWGLKKEAMVKLQYAIKKERSKN